jgi:hypothetical protein
VASGAGVWRAGAARGSAMYCVPLCGRLMFAQVRCVALELLLIGLCDDTRTAVAQQTTF